MTFEQRGTAQGRALAPRMVLLAERDSHARELEACFLAELGFEVETAPDGATAWERASLHPPALVVTEILLPKVDGLALCRRLKNTSETRAIPVLVVSVLAATSRARDAGADGFLLKPLSQARLAAELDRLVQVPGTKERA